MATRTNSNAKGVAKVTTKTTKATTNKATKRLQSVIPVGTTIATRPLFPNEGESNDVKVKAPKVNENRELMNTTVTGEGGQDAQAYDAMRYGSPSDRPYNPVFECTYDAQADRKAEGKAIIPEWQTATVSIDAPDAMNRTNMEIGSYRGTVDDKGTLPVPSYHKSPATKMHTEADNANISKQGSLGNLGHITFDHGYRAG